MSMLPLFGALSGKTVLLRADLSQGVTAELGRAAGKLTAEGARVAVIAGFGAPGGDVNPALSLEQFRPPLQAACGRPVTFIPECVGPVAEANLAKVDFGDVALMENLRFHPDERRDSRSFAMRLSVLGDFFAISGQMPADPIGWLTALAVLLPAPYGALRAASRREP
jgi:phosphoglycerate kinase